MKTTVTQKTMVETLFYRYEYLAVKYANRIFNVESMSIEYDDLLQEFKMKILTAIKSYGARWSKYRKGEASKPVPLKYYLEAACSNRLKDFTKVITRSTNKLRMDYTDFDYGCEDETVIKPEEDVYILKGVDLTEGLNGRDRQIFCMYLKGYNSVALNKEWFKTEEEQKSREAVRKAGDTPITAMDLVDYQRNKLIKKYGNIFRSNLTVYQTYSVQ